MRILLINQCFYPDVAATAQHGWDLARHLRDRGHQVTAIASRSLYGGSGATLLPEETVEGIRIVRVSTSWFGKGSLAGRALDFLSFFVLAGISALRLPRQDLSICFTTPPFISVIGVLLRWIRGTRCVTWLMDLYPDVPVSLGVLSPRSPGCRALDRFSGWLLGRSDAVVVLGRCMAERVTAKGVEPSIVVRIAPWSSEPMSPGDPPPGPVIPTNPYRAAWSAGDRVVFMYSGNFGLGHDFDTISTAVRSTCAQDGVMFAFVGGGKRKAPLLRTLAHEAGNGSVVEAPFQPREKIQSLLASADVHLVSLLPGCEGTMVPSKFYGILTAGRPVVYVGRASGEVAKVISETGCGIVVEPGDVAGLERAIGALRDDPRRRHELGTMAWNAATGKHGRDAALEQWAELVERIGRRSPA
jgi:colanic acid biosynthesis glycosyl transferase WcaI